MAYIKKINYFFAKLKKQPFSPYNYIIERENKVKILINELSTLLRD